MMNKYGKKLLNELIDKYENSKVFTGQSKVNRKISLFVGRLFKEYLSESNLDIFVSVNEAISELVEKDFIYATAKNNVYDKVSLNIERIAAIYSYLERTLKKDVNMQLLSLLNLHKDDNDLLQKYSLAQEKRLKENRVVEGFNGNIAEFRNLLICLSSIFLEEKEIYFRDFSLKALKDSKTFEKLKGKAQSILWKYGNFADKDTIFEELNIIKTPSYVYFKGSGVFRLKEQEINIDSFNNGIGVSSKDLDDISFIKVYAENIVTIENLTSFYKSDKQNCFYIYLGGYHNAARRNLLKLICDANPHQKYFHHGDIDAGGFYIFKHLVEKSVINFVPLDMDIQTLIANKAYWKKLTDNDKTRLKKLRLPIFNDVIKFMLENNCKLEQEALELN